MKETNSKNKKDQNFTGKLMREIDEPSRAWGIASTWIGVGFAQSSLATASTNWSHSPKLLNVLTSPSIWSEAILNSVPEFANKQKKRRRSARKQQQNSAKSVWKVYGAWWLGGRVWAVRVFRPLLFKGWGFWGNLSYKGVGQRSFFKTNFQLGYWSQNYS